MWPVLPGTAVLKFSGGKLTGGTDDLLLLCDNCCCFVIVDRRAPGLEHRSVITAVEATIFVVPVALVLLVPHFIYGPSSFPACNIFFFAVPQGRAILSSTSSV
uniref:(northern house mosquito) hypothetical protein n=1 Tax=Culex pipiens TaxID=7175 RepID=A0A8D8FR89_CULPI